MAKVKNKRNAGLADKVHSKKKNEANKKKLNPFEVHINKEKMKVLGKKSKHDKGLPGVARAKAIQKRKETLGTEMKLMNKTNTFIDRRIGEKNGQLSAEDRMVARFAAERAKQHTRKNIYNLADDEVLTHRGQTLEQIEKFDDPRSDDEDDDGKGFGGLGDDFVSEGHFGGGMLSKTESQDGAKSHKDLIEQLIADSKKRKAEKQKEKEQTLDLTEKLDSEWKDLQPVVFKRARVEDESVIDKVLSKAERKGEDYDKMMRELKFEKRGTPSDGLKSDEKQAKEERERLAQWEKERLERMAGEESVAKQASPTKKHRSAEDLDDNFDLEDEKEFMLAYDKEGKPLVPESILKDFSVPNAKPKYQDGISDTSSDDEDDDEDGNDDSDDENETNQEIKQSKEKITNGNVSSDEDDTILFKKPAKVSDDDESGDESDSEDDDSDDENNIKVQKKYNEDKAEKVGKGNNAVVKRNYDDDDDDKSGNIDKGNNAVVKSNRGDRISDDDDDESSDSGSDNEESDVNDDKVVKTDDYSDLKHEDESENEIELAGDDMAKIGSFFDQKTLEGDNLKELLSDKTPAQITVALQNLIKSYDPGLAQNNKDLLSRLFAHMLQYTNDIFSNINNEGNLIKAFLTFERLVPYFYDLAKTNKVSTKKYLIELLKEKREIYLKKPKRIPDLDTLIFFKLVSLLYPTSDFRHPVTTPSLIFMSEILTLSNFNDAYSISRGLFIIAIILEYTALSKRIVPSAINFIRGILYLSANTTILNPIQVIPPFKLHKYAKILNIEEDRSKMAVENKMAANDLVVQEIDDSFKIRCFFTSVLMLKEFFDNANDIEAQECIFESHIRLLMRVDLENYPKKVRSLVSGVLKDMKDSLEVKTYTPLCREKKKPKALRLYEPDVQEVFTGSKSSKLSREQAESARLKTKYKKEMKGALREIRRDRAYVAAVRIRQKIHSDNVRKRKVKEIYKDASIQQGELNKLKRMK